MQHNQINNKIKIIKSLLSHNITKATFYLLDTTNVSSDPLATTDTTDDDVNCPNCSLVRIICVSQCPLLHYQSLLRTYSTVSDHTNPLQNSIY